MSTYDGDGWDGESAYRIARELDRMPDPTRDPCAQVKDENAALRERLRTAVALLVRAEDTLAIHGILRGEAMRDEIHTFLSEEAKRG
jgi:hypothetical protein